MVKYQFKKIKHKDKMVKRAWCYLVDCNDNTLYSYVRRKFVPIEDATIEDSNVTEFLSQKGETIYIDKWIDEAYSMYTKDLFYKGLLND